ncbi:hypothetical protein PHLH3_21340 [Pseudomonas sp. St386]|nr:hypothetical protein PHLH3_21340 [Pseudomonas sp. St386]
MNATPAGSDTQRLISQMDWALTPLGTAQNWPQSLRTAVDIMLHSPMAMALLWGPQLSHLYNDAFGRLAGDKHPGHSAGRPIQHGPNSRVRPKGFITVCCKARRTPAATSNGACPSPAVSVMSGWT